jgi:ribosomal protein S18 acetylase RimI-like enzyme
MSLEIRLLGPGDDDVLSRVAPDVFDHAVQPGLAGEFLRDPRHHIVVALDEGYVVGFASAVHYVHPDKPAELWINEVGVAGAHQRQGIGKQLLRVLLEAGRASGCRLAWVLTDRTNDPAVQLYRAVGGVEAPGQTVMIEFTIDGQGAV